MLADETAKVATGEKEERALISRNYKSVILVQLKKTSCTCRKEREGLAVYRGHRVCHGLSCVCLVNSHGSIS